ncbi:MAG: hypothetical protein ACI8WY_004199, partial [Planctomycetota bacterium]
MKTGNSCCIHVTGRWLLSLKTYAAHFKEITR